MIRIRNRRILPMILTAGLAMALSACDRSNHGGADTDADQVEPLDILIDWQAEPTYLGVYYAVESGYLREAGYDAKVTQSWGANQAVAAVASGTHVIGTASGGATVLGRNNGADVVSTGVLYPRIPTVVYGLASSGITKPEDLKGKKIGIYPGSITNNEFDAFLKLNGLSKDDVEIVSLSGADIPLLLSGQVDAVLHYTEMSPVQVEVSRDAPGTAGQRTFELHLADYGVGGYGLNIIANRQALNADGSHLREASAAIVRGYVEGCRNREEAVSVFLRLFPDKDRTYVSQSWDRVCDLVGDNPGYQDEAGWDETISLYRGLSLLTAPATANDIMGQ